MKYYSKTEFASESEKQKMKIQDLSYDFAKRIVITCKQYNNSKSIDYIIFRQILKSGTSIGANITEAQHPQSDADYLSKMNIALKEASETEFWIRLLKDCNYISEYDAESLSYDCLRIIKILTTIVNKVSSRIRK